MKILAIIPARGGSKSILLKNIKKLNKVPLISYTIRNCIKSKIFNHIIVTTDSKKIFNLAKKYKNIIALDRSKSISKDTSRVEEAVSDVLGKIFLIKKYQPDWIFILQPTSPLRSVDTLIKAKNIIIRNNKINSLISLLELNSNPGKLKNSRFIYFEKRRYRRQEHQSFFMESSTLYCVKYKYFKRTKKIVEKKPFGFKVPKIECVDINDLDDFKIAEALAKESVK